MHRAAMLFLCLTAVAFPLSKSYDVVPFRNYIGTQIQGDVGVAQYFRNTLDSLTMVSFWCGDKGNGEAFNVEVWDSAGPRVAHKTGFPAPSQSWTWLNIPLDYDTSPVRGRTYKVIVTRPTGAAISFAHDTTNPALV
jgi:hypothetical protein